MKPIFWLCYAMFCVMIAGCSPSDSFSTRPYVEPGPEPTSDIQIRLWAEDHPLLPAYDTVLDGCRQWWPNDVDCVLTDESDSSMRINAITPEDVVDPLDVARRDYANCVEQPDGTRTLAISTGGGWIEIFPLCFAYKDDEGNITGYNTRLAMSVITHEVGHELGLPHVEKMCTRNSLSVPGEGGICGDAIMNPIMDANVTSPTQVDDILFNTFIHHVSLPNGFTACTLKSF